jgi:hypothetical protein
MTDQNLTTNQVTEQPVKINVTEELAKINVTDTLIAQYKKQSGTLVIKDLNDRAGFNAVKDFRLTVKRTRLMAEKVFKAGKEPAYREYQAWLTKEKEVTGKLKEIEDPLEAKENKWEADREEQRKKDERERIQGRINQLTPYLDKIDFLTISTISDDEFNALVKTSKEAFEAKQAQALADKAEKERLARENELLKQQLNANKIDPLPVIPADNNIPDLKVTPKGSDWPITSDKDTGAQGEIGAVATFEGKPVSSITEWDKEALLKFAKDIDNLPFPTLKGSQAKQVLTSSLALLSKVSGYIRGKV